MRHGASAGEQYDTSLPEGAGDALDVSDERLALASAFEALDERERQIVYLRFVRDRSRSQVAQELGISGRHLSRQTHAALAKLREQLERGRTGDRAARAPRSVPPQRLSARRNRHPPPRRGAGPIPRAARQPPTRHHGHPPYRISIVRDHGNAEGHEWTAHAQELPGCEAHGDSPEQAIRGIEAAIEEWIEDALAKGRELPRPAADGKLQRSSHAPDAAVAARRAVRGRGA